MNKRFARADDGDGDGLQTQNIIKVHEKKKIFCSLWPIYHDPMY